MKAEFEPVVALEQIADGALTAPVALAAPDDESGRRFFADQIGLIYVIGEDDTMMSEPFLDLRDRMVTLNPDYDERGLLGLAFHPDYAENGRFFVYYSAPLRDAPLRRLGSHQRTVLCPTLILQFADLAQCSARFDGLKHGSAH